MNLKINVNKHRLWLIFLLIIPVFSDSAYGIADTLNIHLLVGPGVLLRGVILIVATLYVIRHLSILPFASVTFYFLIYITIIPGVLIGIASGSNFSNELFFMSKAVFFPTMILMFIALMRKGTSSEDVMRYIEYICYISSIMLVLPGLINLQVSTYGDYAFGVKGFFKPGNDIGLALGLAILASGYRVLFIKYSIIRFLLICLSIYAITMLGSRASLVILAVFATTILSAILLSRNEIYHSVPGIKMITSSVMLTMLLIGALSYGLITQSSFNYQKDKIDQLLSGELPRKNMLNSGNEYLASRPSHLILTGEGTERYMRGIVANDIEEEFSIAEVDWIDAYGRYGLLFTSTLYGYLLLSLFTATKNLILIVTPLSFVLMSALALFMAHSIFAGHALFSPTPSTIAAAYVALIIHVNRRTNSKLS